jgi:hypothetical protein
MKKLALDCGLFAIVDDEDYEDLKDSVWHIKWRTPTNPYVYRYIKRPKSSPYPSPYYAQRLHSLLLSPPKGYSVDHTNGDCLDNRRSNLRLATQRQQAQNSRIRGNGGQKKKSSSYKGVSKNGLVHRKHQLRNPWRARIRVDGKLITLGWFATQEEAALSYNKAATKYFGAFACLNDVNPEAVKK